jgi:hypothetical protein
MGWDPNLGLRQHYNGSHMLLKIVIFYFKGTLIGLPSTQLYCVKPRLHFKNKENMLPVTRQPSVIFLSDL